MRGSPRSRWRRAHALYPVEYNGIFWPLQRVGVRLRCIQHKPAERALDADTGQPSKRRELTLFLFITVVLFPILSVMIVGGYGFAVWIYQMFTGPPTA